MIVLFTILIGGSVLFCASMCKAASTREMLTENIYFQINAGNLHKDAFKTPRNEMEIMTDMVLEESEVDE